tara:strand:+ start:5421 stop:6080 length:660 start_codon:yes stop_codon:yes gene_type:complete
MLLKIENLYKSYQVNNKKIHILNDLSLSINDNEIVSIFGASGSGKSTLLNIISGLLSYDSGEIYFNRNIFNSSFNFTNYRKNDIGIVFQEDFLLKEFNVIENIMIPNIIKGIEKKTAYNNAMNFLEKFNLSSIKDQYPSSLSGGEKQRVSIIRSVINKPKLILADEPTGSIDEENKNKVFSLFESISNDLNTSILIMTHDNNVSNISNNILNLSKGKLK